MFLRFLYGASADTKERNKNKLFYKGHSLSALLFSNEVMANEPIFSSKYNSLAITESHILFFAHVISILLAN